MTSETSIAPTQFINVQVIATPSVDPTTGKTKYTTQFIPEAVSVYEQDVVINYQLIAPTPEGVQIKKLTVNQEEKKQFSTPSISQSGKLATLSDANTVQGKFNVTLYFIDKDMVEFNVDPEVFNDLPPMK